MVSVAELQMSTEIDKMILKG